MQVYSIYYSMLATTFIRESFLHFLDRRIRGDFYGTLIAGKTTQRKKNDQPTSQIQNIKILH